MDSAPLQQSPSLLSNKLYRVYIILAVLAMIVVKLWIASDVTASAAFCDDYNYLNKSPYYLRGDLKMHGYPFENLFAGVLYPLVISPWLLWNEPSSRILVVHTINILLSAVTMLFGSLIVARLSQKRSLLAPICLACFITPFLFSFYAMTENLVFTLLAVLGWLMVDVEQTCKHKARLALLLAVTVMLPLTRSPGMAVVPAVLVVLWLNRRALGFKRSAGVALCVAAAAVGFYLLFMALAPSIGRAHEKREAHYIGVLLKVYHNPGYLILAAKLALNQGYYLLLSTGYWVVPVLLVMGLQIRRLKPGEERQIWVNYWVFMAVSVIFFTAFSLLHLLPKTKFSPADSNFIMGRYSDPSAILILIGGLAAVMVPETPSRFGRFLLRVVAPLMLCLAVDRVWHFQWANISQSGLVMLCRRPPAFPLEYLLLFIVVATLLSQWMPPSRLRAPAMMIFFLVLQWVSINRALIGITLPRAHRIAYSVKAADWIDDHLPKTARIGYDWSVYRKGAPHAWSIMYHVYRTMIFSTYPRPATMVRTPEQLQNCDYLYTIASRENEWGFPAAWSNRDYVLYRVEPSAGDEKSEDHPKPTTRSAEGIPSDVTKL